MPRRKTRKPPASTTPEYYQPGPLAHNPFQSLKGVAVEHTPAEPEPEPENIPPAEMDETDLFQSAMAEVTPLEQDFERIAGPAGGKRPERPREIVSADLEVIEHLNDLVSGRVQFDLVNSDEYVEGYVKGMSPIVLEKLRRGHFSVQAYLDLHGLTAREAEEEVGAFVSEAVSLGYRCVLLVHGRGLNSKDQIPVLKKRLETMLLRGPVRRHIIAFSSARPVDGGPGASYVLLRAKRG